MKKDLNIIKNDKLIKVGQNWDFFFLEDDDYISSPIIPHYFMCHDMSINLSLRLKWALYGYFFLKSLENALNDDSYLIDISFTECVTPNFNKTKFDKKLLIDDIDTNSFNVFKNQFENEYNKKYYSQNSLIRFKLKLNISEYVIIQNRLFPKLAELE